MDEMIGNIALVASLFAVLAILVRNKRISKKTAIIVFLAIIIPGTVLSHIYVQYGF